MVLATAPPWVAEALRHGQTYINQGLSRFLRHGSPVIHGFLTAPQPFLTANRATFLYPARRSLVIKLRQSCRHVKRLVVRNYLPLGRAIWGVREG
jgi:hypothetical protein